MKDPMDYKNIKALEEFIKKAKLDYEVENDIGTAIKVSLMTPLIIKMIDEGVFETYIDNIGVMSLTEMDHFLSDFFKLLTFMKSSLQSRKIPLKSMQLSNDGVEKTNIYIDGVKVKTIEDEPIKDKHKPKADLSKLAALAALFNDHAFTSFINEKKEEEEEEEDEEDDKHSV